MKSTLGERIHAARIRRGMTQFMLAEQLGVKTNTISQWEHDKRSPAYDMLDSIAAALQCTASSLLEDREIPPETEEELWELRETLRRRPEMRILFDATKNATAEDLMSVVEIVETLKRRGRI